MADYVRQLSNQDILGASFSIFATKFVTIGGIALLPGLFWVAVAAFATIDLAVHTLLLLTLLSYLTSVLMIGALTIAVGDLCLQRRMSIVRAWRGAFRNGGIRLLWTFLLSLSPTILALIVGVIVVIASGRLLSGSPRTIVGIAIMIVALFAGMFASTIFMFSTCIVVLENISGIKALRRSRELGSGKLLRNVGVVILVAIPSYALAVAIHVVLLSLGPFRELGEGTDMSMMLRQQALSAIQQVALSPIYIAAVLLYYDMRARKEAFDSTALAQELLQ